jgi:hypothetical protein
VHRRVLAVAMTLIVAACGGSGPAGSPSPTPETALPAGTHSSAVFQPAVTFTVPDGWILATDSADYLQLRPVDQDVLGIHMFRGVQAASQDPTCPVAAAPGVGTTSTELVTWIRGLQGLVVSSPAMVTVDNLRGSSIDIGIATGWTQSCPFANGVPTVPLLVEPGTGLRWVIAGSERLRLDLLDLPGGGILVIDVDAFDGSFFDSLVAAATPIVKSMRFATS